MKDTPKEIDLKWKSNLLEISPEERIKIACSMFDFARDLVVESIRNEFPNISDAELNRKTLRRIYGQQPWIKGYESQTQEK